MCVAASWSASRLEDGTCAGACTAAAAAQAVARATVQLDGLTSTASTAVVAAVCGLTGFLLLFAIGYTIRDTQRRDAELRKMNSVG